MADEPFLTAHERSWMRAQLDDLDQAEHHTCDGPRPGVGPLSPWVPPWIEDTSRWLYGPGRFAHAQARTDDGDLMSSKPTTVTVTALLNPTTGEWVTCPAGTQIMSNDLDWLTDSWQQVFAIEQKIQQAEREAGSVSASP